MTTPTHARIDGAVHLVTKVDEHGDGPHHTHRVHLACGLTVDVDIGGARAAAHAQRRAEEHESAEWRERHAQVAWQKTAEGETWEHERWTRHAGEATCKHCAAVENGAAQSITHARAHTPARVRRADVSTELPCPTCGTGLYIRHDGTVACAGQGHEFTVPEALGAAMGLLRRLADGNVSKE